MIEIRINIDEIDYGSLAKLILPFIKEKAENGELPIWAKLAFISGGMNESAVMKIIDKIPNDKKVDFLVNTLNSKKVKTAEFIENIALKNGVNLKVSDLEVKNIRR